MERTDLSIGAVARLSGLPIKTIRYYEEVGLIPKAARRSGGVHTGGHRVYGESDIGRLKFVHHARLCDLSLADIRKLLAVAERKGCPSSQPEYQQVLESHLLKIDERIRYLLELRTVIGGMISAARQPLSRRRSWSTCACMRHASLLAPGPKRLQQDTKAHGKPIGIRIVADKQRSDAAPDAQ